MAGSTLILPRQRPYASGGCCILCSVSGWSRKTCAVVIEGSGGVGGMNGQSLGISCMLLICKGTSTGEAIGDPVKKSDLSVTNGFGRM